jgi:hypothetical protein
MLQDAAYHESLNRKGPVNNEAFQDWTWQGAPVKEPPDDLDLGFRHLAYTQNHQIPIPLLDCCIQYLEDVSFRHGSCPRDFIPFKSFLHAYHIVCKYLILFTVDTDPVLLLRSPVQRNIPLDISFYCSHYHFTIRN